jgi:1-deoxy-D-xylulose-5-phosphate reductoisomerase
VGVVIRVCILGATGSIGMSTLDVIKQHAHQFKVVALTANQDVERLFQQCVEFLPRYAVMADAAAAEQLAARLAHFDEITVLSGVEGLKHVASLPEVDTVMAAIVGGAGLLPTLAAAQAGKRVLLANKEALVMSGQLFLDAVHQHGAQLLPIDSEHNAIFQCMPASFTQHGVKNLTAVGVSRILLTASGGPFRNYPLDQLSSVTPEQACNHPKWKMGRKISVDSATMMNKGLEVIEACWLFNTPPERIEVLIHPQSVIHSMVEYVDGSVLAQLGNPDMRTPIAHALAFPERMTSGVARLNLLEIAKLEFEPMDFARFPCLRLAYEAMQAGGTTTAILNAANEIAVEAFLAGKLRFTAISELIEQTLSRLNGRAASTLEIILEDDARARHLAEELLTTL